MLYSFTNYMAQDTLKVEVYIVLLNEMCDMIGRNKDHDEVR